MGCFKQLSIAASTTDQFTPLYSAVYVPSTQEILGTSENYICRFNASTGAYVNQVKALPVYGPMNICLVNGVPYISAWNQKETLSIGSPQPLKDIFPVNPVDLSIGAGLGFITKFEGFNVSQWSGPAAMIGVGTRVYAYQQIYGGNVIYIDTANPVDYGGSSYLSDWMHGFASDGTYIYAPETVGEDIQRYNLNLSSSDYSNTPGYKPTATEWVDHSNPAYKKCYAVCGSKWLIRVDDFLTSTNAYIDLDALTGQTNTNPFRIRFNPTDDLVYMPCQEKNAIIVYDPVAGTAVWKSGFDSPVDVVFSLLLSGKKFAVQTGLVGLKEIV